MGHEDELVFGNEASPDGAVRGTTLPQHDDVLAVVPGSQEAPMELQGEGLVEEDPPKARGPLWWLVVAPTAVRAFVGMMREVIPLSKRPIDDIVQVYRQATGVGRDEANADRNAIEERLRRIPRYGDSAEELVGRAACRLVDWVISGRPTGDEAWQAMESAFEELAAFEDEARGEWGRHYHRYGPIQARYQQTWQAILASPGPPS